MPLTDNSYVLSRYLPGEYPSELSLKNVKKVVPYIKNSDYYIDKIDIHGIKVEDGDLLGFFNNEVVERGKSDLNDDAFMVIYKLDPTTNRLFITETAKEFLENNPKHPITGKNIKASINMFNNDSFIGLRRVDKAAEAEAKAMQSCTGSSCGFSWFKRGGFRKTMRKLKMKKRLTKRKLMKKRMTKRRR
jgi:hypothetical protein